MSPNRTSRPTLGRLIAGFLLFGLVLPGIHAAVAAGNGKDALPPYHAPLPIAEPRLLADAQISTADFESHPAFDAIARVAYFVKSTPDRRFGTILVSRYAGAWSPPTLPPFS